MDVLELLKTRRSIRKYKTTPVEQTKIERCLEAARWAPSASNKQPWEFLIVTNKEMREKLAALHPYAKFVKESPVVFVPLTNPEVHQKYHWADTALATLQFMIQAHGEGLGTCWAGIMGAPFENEIKTLLNIPDHLNCLALVAIGYADEKRESNRKTLKEITHFEKYTT